MLELSVSRHATLNTVILLLQQYSTLPRGHSGDMPSRLCMALGVVPYMVMAAVVLLRLDFSEAEASAASRLLKALIHGGKLPARFETVLGEELFNSGLSSLQRKVHAQIGALLFNYFTTRHICACRTGFS